MLKHTFCHIPGIGEKREQFLWSLGIASWEAVFTTYSLHIPPPVQELLNKKVEESFYHYRHRNVGYFIEQLESKHHWRLYRDFRDSCAFLDIETTGLFPPNKITTIALYDGRDIRVYIRGINLDRFIRDLQDYSLLITYNGKSFDVPLIKAHFGINLATAHVDLRYFLQSLGYRGGLKQCLHRIGLRWPLLEDVSGPIAAYLWEEYRKGKNPKALETLLAYNVHDVIALNYLTVHVYNEKLKSTPFQDILSLGAPLNPIVPYQPDRATLERIRRRALTLS
jgi:uncharacterized protein YprB with RNaseH-like and TPR domain